MVDRCSSKSGEFSKEGLKREERAKLVTKVAYICWKIWKRSCAATHGQEKDI